LKGCAFLFGLKEELKKIGSECCRQSEWFVRDDLRRPQIDLLWRTFSHHSARCHTDHQQLANVAIALLRDLAQTFLSTTGFVEWGQSKPGRQIAPGPELFCVASCANWGTT